jgi:prepilin-type N-terminal cleavage/methylation domain-containing protein
MQRFRKNQKGFTMIELMVVVVIVGVLAAIAIPIYGKYIKNARVTEATGRIGEVITAAKAYAQENQDPATGDPQWPAAFGPGGSTGIVDLTATPNFTYEITAGGGDANTNPLTIVATGQAQMAGPPAVTVTVTVDNINSNGDAPIIANL